jgi:hypothetical protein
MPCVFASEGADWNRGGVMRGYCEIHDELNCEDCEDYQEDDE